MAQLQLARSSWKRIEGPDIPLVNLFFEQDPRNLREQTALYQRPGLTLFATCGAGPIRAIFRKEGVLSGDFIVVSGTSLYRVTVAGTVTQLGTSGAIPGTGRVSIAGNATRVYLANGTGLYTSTGSGAPSAVTFPDGAGVASVAYINGYFLFVRTGSQAFYWLIPGSTTIDALDFASAENSPDALLAIVNYSDELWMFGASTVEVFDPTGDSEFPFMRTVGKLFNLSCTNKDTIAVADMSLLWVGENGSTGGRMVYLGGDVPIRVSDNHIEELLNAATAASLRGWAFGIDGHIFYALSIGTETVVYDLATKVWTNFQSPGLSEWRAHLGASRGDGKVIGADSVDGRLWLLDTASNKDGTEVFTRQWSARHAVRGEAPACARVALQMTVGNAAGALEPFVSISYSDDDGETFTTPWDASLGTTGQTRRVVEWRQLGDMEGDYRDFRFSLDDDVRVVIRSGVIE